VAPQVQPQQIAEVRRFNRLYVRQIGLLREGYLGSGFSVAEVRVLYELANRKETTASLTVAFWPSRNLTESVLPSTLVISPRTRTGGACCAHAIEAEAISANPATPSVRRVIVCMFGPP
jgi:hypothetical protein